MTPRIDHLTVAPDAFKAMLALECYVRNSGLETSLLHLIKLRGSYLNGCAYCVDMHTKEARHDGESEQRLYSVPVWQETPFFSPRERAALRWTEAVTLLGHGGVPDEVYQEARTQFSEAELVNLTIGVIAINDWNRLAISFRAEPGTYTVPVSQKV